MQDKNDSRLDRMLDYDTENRFDRWVEFFSAIILALATVATAWCGYQAARWGGEQARSYIEANALTTRSAATLNLAVQIRVLHADLFVEWVSALNQDNLELAEFLYERFPSELRIAVDAWLDMQPFDNLDAPKTPFKMEEYSLPQEEQALELEQQSDELFAEANTANEISDNYVLLTVIFASVLFFGGISGKFKSQLIDLVMLVFAIVLFGFGLFILLGYPLH